MKKNHSSNYVNKYWQLLNDLSKKDVNFVNFLPLRDLKLVCYIPKFVKTEFVMSVKFDKDLLRIFPETSQNFLCIRVRINEFYSIIL